MFRQDTGKFVYLGNDYPHLGSGGVSAALRPIMMKLFTTTIFGGHKSCFAITNCVELAQFLSHKGIHGKDNGGASLLVNFKGKKSLLMDNLTSVKIPTSLKKDVDGEVDVVIEKIDSKILRTVQNVIMYGGDYYQVSFNVVKHPHEVLSHA